VGPVVLSVFLGYLVGSFPTAFLLVHWKSQIDIRNAGSGNVGTLNSFLVTRSWFVGSVVLVIDILKGAAGVWVGATIGGSALHAGLAGAGVIIGHNYPVWLSFKGGRGLAPAAGAALMVSWVIVPAWLVMWGLAYFLVRGINAANAVASGVLLLAALVVPPGFSTGSGGEDGGQTVRWFVVAIMGIILLRHIGPVKEFFALRRGVPGARP
jgi:glycerol-3-phosphate acyltransferase PlsY